MRTGRRRVLHVTALAALVAATAACQTDQPPAESPEPTVESPEPSDEPTEEPTEEPEPSEEPTGGPATDEDVLVNGPNAIESPTSGETLTGPEVTITGEGTAFEATLLYRVLEAGTEDVVDEGFTMAGANGEVGPFELTLTLDPGSYTVQLWEPDMSDGAEGDGEAFRNLVQVTFTVE